MNTLFPVVILAGGLATRLRPVTITQPKSLITINQEPFIAHQLRILRKNNIKEVVLCIGHLGEQIEGYLGRGHFFDLKITYVYDGPDLLGTAGAIKQALPHLSDSFFVLYGDSYLPCDYYAIQNYFIKADRFALMTIFQNQDKWDTSNVEYAEGKIITYDKFNKNPRMHYIDYGLSLFNQAAFEYVPSDKPSDLADLYKTLIRVDGLAALEVSERFYETGSFAGIKELENYLKSNENN